MDVITMLLEKNFEQPTKGGSDEHATYYEAMRSGNVWDIKAVPIEDDTEIYVRLDGNEDWIYYFNASEHE
jgi:hypothetical protein